MLLSQGKPVPEPHEGPDRFEVTVRRHIIKPEVIDFLAKVDQTFQLTQRERIALGLLAQHEALTARELVRALELPSVDTLSTWINRLTNWRLVLSSGRTQATRYYVDPAVLRRLEFTATTSLKRIEPHRLQALVIEDLHRYPNSAIGEINKRIGEEIDYKQVKKVLDTLCEAKRVVFSGERRLRKYRLAR